MNGAAPVPNSRDSAYRPVLIASIAAVFVLLLVGISYWSLIDVLTVFLAPLVVEGSWIVLGAAGAVALGYVVWRRGRGLRSWLPLGVCLVGAALGRWVPFTELWLSSNYHMHRSARRRVVEAFEAKLLPLPMNDDSTMAVHLPWASGTSNGGDVLVSQHAHNLSILFFTFRGILSHYSGYLYRSDTLPLPAEVFGDRVCESQPIEQHWFFTAYC